MDFSKFQDVRVDICDGGIAIVAINRPDKLNARRAITLGELERTFEALESSDDIRGVVLTGAQDQKGRRHMAGADINELAALTNARACEHRASRAQWLVAQIRDMDTPVISALDGYIFGAGCEISMACHGRVITSRSYIGQPEVKLGFIPGSGGCILLPRLVGFEMANELLRTGRPMTGAEAKACGWAGWIVDPSVEDVVNLTINLLTAHLRKPNPHIHRVSDDPVEVPNPIPDVALDGLSIAIDGILTDLLKHALDLEIKVGMQREAQAFGACFNTEDWKIGTENFIANGPRVQACFVHR